MNNAVNNNGKIGIIGPFHIGPTVYYDSSENKTLISVLDHTGLGGNMEGIIITYDHQTRKIGPRKRNKNNVASNSGVVDTHQGQSVISLNGVSVVAQERQHNSPIYFNSGSISSGAVNFGTLSSFGSSLAYPCLQVYDSTIYAIARDAFDQIHLYKSTDTGSSFSGPTVLCDLIDTDWVYPAPIYYPFRSAFVFERRKNGSSGEYTELFFVQTDDGTTFYNVDSTFAKTGTISDSELTTNFLIYGVDSVGIGQNVLGTRVQHCGQRLMIPKYEYAAGTDSVIELTLYYADDKQPFQSKTMPTIKLGWFVRVSGDTYDYIVNENNNIYIYRTTDFFDTISLRKIISAQWDINRVRVTRNHNQSNEILITGQITGKNGNDLEGTNNYLGLYIYNKNE